MTVSGRFPWLVALADRRLPVLTAVRVAAIPLLAFCPGFVTLPTALVPSPLVVFVPLAVGIPSALALLERLGWMEYGRAGRRARLLRVASSLLAEVLVAGVLIGTLGPQLVHAPGVAGVIGSALGLAGLGYLVGTWAPRLAWLVVAAAGTLLLLSPSSSGIPFVLTVPWVAGAVVWVASFLVWARCYRRREEAT